MRVLHPADAFGDLDVSTRGQRVGIVEGCGLGVDGAGEVLRVAIEQAGAAGFAEIAAAMFGGGVLARLA